MNGFAVNQNKPTPIEAMLDEIHNPSIICNHSVAHNHVVLYKNIVINSYITIKHSQ